MEESSQTSIEQSGGTQSDRGERLVFVMPQDAMSVSTGADIDLLELWNVFWSSRWLISAITAVFVTLAVVYALIATEWYSADVLLVPTEERSTQGLGGLVGQLGGLASLAGVSVGGGDNVEPLAVLTSRDFTRAFIEDLDLLTVLFADDWDEERQRWKFEDPEDWPDLRDAVKYFDEEVRSVDEDSNGLVTLTIEWTDRDTAAEWANLLVKRLNDRMRQRALQEAETNVAYLQEELTDTNVVTLRQSISRLLETELQKLMLARGNEEFSFRVIDRAEPPKRRSKPNRILIVALALVFGGIISMFIVFVRHVVGVQRQNQSDKMA